jgi:hypothetical protein
MGIISDLLDLAVGISTTRNDNDTTITTDSHDKVTYKVNNTDNSDRSIRNNYTYTDNSKIDNSIIIKNYYNDGDNAGNGSNNSDLRAICRVSATQVRVGDTVNFVADVSGGDSPYKYNWTGDGSGDGSSETFRFNREGTYSLSVRVTDDSGDTDTDGCATVNVSANGVNNTNTGTNTPPTGSLASLSSVFLSQIPYTGLAGEGGILKVIGYFLGILVWAVAIVYFIAKRKSRMGVKNKIEAFRTFNKFSPKIV